MKGLVIKNTGSWYQVKTDDGQFIECKIKGNFRLKGIRSTNPVAVGDRVQIILNQEGTAFINEIEDRKNYIIRRSSNLSKQSHILAANLDQCMLVVTVNYPETSTIFIDRFLASAEAYRVPVKLVFNKVDAYNEDELRYLDALINLYTHIGYPCFKVSAKEGTGVDAIKKDLEGKITLFSGHSGVGKSTLINAIVGEKVSITSKKPQTTRNRVLGVLTTDKAQFIFVDTPGFQTKVKNQLTRRMNRSVRSTLSEVDAVVMVIESNGWKPGDLEVLRLLPTEASNVILAVSKTDLSKDRNALLPLMADSMRRYPFAAIVPVSAEKHRQLDDLLREIEKLLPESIPYFDPDLYTDKSPRFLAAETIREKAFRLLGDELPYGTAVTIDKWKEETDDKGVRRADIVATLIVDRESHKPIVIGEKGAKLREISRLARADIEEQLGCPVHLEVWVRVRRGWSDDVKALKTLGYD